MAHRRGGRSINNDGQSGGIANGAVIIVDVLFFLYRKTFRHSGESVRAADGLGKRKQIDGLGSGVRVQIQSHEHFALGFFADDPQKLLFLLHARIRARAH